MIYGLVTRGGMSLEAAEALAVVDAFGLYEFWTHTPPLRDLVKVIVEALVGPLPSPPQEGEVSAAEDIFPPDVET